MPTFSQEVDLTVSAKRMWLAMKDVPSFLPKIAPHFVSSMEQIEGVEGKPGAKRLVKFGTAAPEGAYVKETLVAMDHATLTFTTEEYEGGHLRAGFTKWSSTVKIVPTGDSSCKLVASVEYEGGDAATEIPKAQDGFVKLFKESVHTLNPAELTLKSKVPFCFVDEETRILVGKLNADSRGLCLQFLN